MRNQRCRYSFSSIGPELVILDIEEAPDLGIKFAQFMSESVPGVRFIAAGPLLQPEHMLTAMRAGVVDYLPKPVTGEAMRASLDRIRAALGHGGKDGGPKQPGKLYAFYSAKGGAGTTTTATNFAVVLHRVTGKKTLLVDLDLELGEIALLLGVQPRFNFVDMVQNFHRMDAELLASYIERHSCGVHLLSAPYQPDKAEVVTGEEIRRVSAAEPDLPPLSLKDREVVLVDDVIYTGRTVKSALSIIFKAGRPRSVRLAVLVDRGHREVPVKPNYVLKHIPSSDRERVRVKLREAEHDEKDKVIIYSLIGPAESAAETI